MMDRKTLTIAQSLSAVLICCAPLVASGEDARPSKFAKWFKLSKVTVDHTRQEPVVAAQPSARSDQHEVRRPTQPAEPQRTVDVQPTPESTIQQIAVQDYDEDVKPAQQPVAAPVVTPMPETSAPMTAQTPFATDDVTLELLTSLADTHHPRLTVAYQNIVAAQGQTVQAGLKPNPVAAFSSPQWDGPESQFNGFVSQEFVTAGKLKLSSAAASRAAEQARFEWQRVRFEILTEVRLQFYTTLADQRRVEILESLVEIARHSLDISQKLLEAGEGTRGDALLLEIELQRAEVALANTRTEYELGMRQLAILVGMPDYPIERLAANLEAATAEYELDEVRFAIAARHPRAQVARLEVDRTLLLLRRACVEPIPNIDLMGGYQRQVGVPQEDQGLFQVTVSIPLWNKNQGNITTAQADVAGARAEWQNTELELATLATDALTTYRTARQFVTRYDESIIPKARETLDLTQRLYAQGQVDFLRLLQAQKTFLDAELSRVDAQKRRWQAAAGLAGLLQEDVFP